MTDKPKNIQEALAEVRRKSLVEEEPADIVDRSKKIEDQIRQSGAGQVVKDILQRAQDKASDLYRDWTNSEIRQKSKDVQKQIVKDVDKKLLGYEYKREDPTAPVGRAERGPGDKVFKKGKTINTGETDPTSGKYLERVVKENDNPLIDAFLRLHELTAFERKFAQEMKRQHGPGPGKTFDWRGTKIALKYATDKPKPAAPKAPAAPAAATPAGPAAATRGLAAAAKPAATDSSSRITPEKVRHVTVKFGDDDRMNAFISPETFANKKFVPGKNDRNVLDTTEKTPPAPAQPAGGTPPISAARGDRVIERRPVRPNDIPPEPAPAPAPAPQAAPAGSVGPMQRKDYLANPAAEDRAAERIRNQNPPPNQSNSDLDPFGAAKALFGPLVTGKQYDPYTGKEKPAQTNEPHIGRLIKLPDSSIPTDQIYSKSGLNKLQRNNELQRRAGRPMIGIDESKTNNEEFSLSSIFGQKTEKPRDVSDKEFPLSTNYRLPPKMHQDMVKNYMDKAVSPVGITNKSASPQKYNFPSPVDVQKGRVLNVDRALSKINNPDHVMASDPERLKKPVATIPFQMKEYLDRTSGKPPMKEDISDTVKDLYNRAKEAITGSSKGNRLTPSEPERSTDIFKAAPGSKESIGISDYPGKNIGQGNKFSSRVPKDDDKPMSGISPAPKPMSGISPAPKPKPYFDYQNRQYRGVPPHQTGKGRAIDSNRETYLEQTKPQSETPWSGGYHQSLQGTTGSGKEYSGQSGSTGPDYSDTTPKQKPTPTTPKYEDGGKRKKMSEENSSIIDMFLKLQEKNTLSPNIFEAAKKMSAKEKSLASLGHPKDKITKKDVLIGRGVLPKEVDEASIYSGKNPFAPGGPNSPIGPGGSENFGRAVTVEKEPKPARPADSTKPKSFVDPKNPTVQGSGDITFDGRPTRVKEGMEDIEAPKYRSAEDVKKAKQPNGYEYKFDTDTKSTFERMRGLSGKDAKVMEELKGNQHRIDANKNGKIDSEDFKLLRSKKKVEEEVDHIDEISKGKAIRAYSARKLQFDAEYNDGWGSEGQLDHDDYGERSGRKAAKTLSRIHKKFGSKIAAHAKRAADIDSNGRPNRKGGSDYLAAKQIVYKELSKPGSKKGNKERKEYMSMNKGRFAKEETQIEEVEFSQAEIDYINSFLEAVAPNRPEPTKGVNPTVRNTDLTDETVDEARSIKGAEPHFPWMRKPKVTAADAQKSQDYYNQAKEKRDRQEAAKKKTNEEYIEEGRPRKNPTPETTERDAREHIQVQAGRAAGGTVIDFKHDDGKISKLTPGMGRRITAHLNGLKPAERQEAVKRMHASPEGLKV